MIRPCYNNLFQFIQHDNLSYLNRIIFIHWKYLKSQVNVFWYYFLVIKRYTFNYLMKPHSRKPELFWNVAIVWYTTLSKFSDIIF